MTGRPAPGRAHDREILRLAVPAFLALVAEPLFLLADSAIVGHLGTPQLAALGIASAVLGTLVSLCIFLAYGTTASVARQVGAGNTGAALAQGVDGLWLAILIGALATLVVLPLTGPIVGLFGPGDRVADLAATYLRIALLGAVPLLLMLAATGVLRGLQDTRTPLVVAVVGNLANIALNVALVYGVGLGHRRVRAGAPCSPRSDRPSRWAGSWSGPPVASPLRCDRTCPGSARRAGPAYP